ncbi:MAG: hypothetical protein EOM20_08100 [Spartobacteria bacterium]|nr:hypothetical protein [Spartobacteria bacterium]
MLRSAFNKITVYLRLLCILLQGLPFVLRADEAMPEYGEELGAVESVVPDGGTPYEEPAPGPPLNAYEIYETNALDRAHHWLSDRVANTFDAFDRFVGKEDENCHGERCEAIVKLSQKVEISEGGTIKFRPNISLSLRLPRLQNRVRVVFDQFVDNDRALPTLGEDDDERQFAGVKVALTEEGRKWQVDLDSGIKINHGLVPFVALEVYRDIELGAWTLRFKEAAAWFRDDGCKLYSQVKWIRPLYEDWYFDSSTRLTWEEDESGITLAQSFLNFRHDITDKSYLGIGCGAVMVNRPATVMDKYRAAIVYERRIFRPWMAIEINPVAEFPREREYAFTPSITLKFSMYFGRINGIRPYNY